MAKTKINIEVKNLEKAIKLLKEYKELIEQCIALKEELIYPKEITTRTTSDYSNYECTYTLCDINGCKEYTTTS